jgi:hypothetical protein
LRRITRHAVNLAAEFHRQARRDQRTRVLRSFDNHNSQRHSGNDPVSNREILRRRERAHRKLRDDCAAPRHFLEYFPILLGINHIDTAAQHANRSAQRGAERTFVRAGIDSPR